MTASANRSEAGETTTRPETRFHKKNQAELVLAQSRVFQQARWFDWILKNEGGSYEFLERQNPRP